MPPDLRAHVRYPELLLALQAEVYGLYHMTDPRGVLQPRGPVDGGDATSASTERARAGDAADGAELRADEAARRDEHGVRRDAAVHAGEPQQPDRLDRRPQRRASTTATSIVYDFPKTRLVDGPLQIEARIDQNAQLSGQLSLWNQQGSHVRRGPLLVIPDRPRAAVCRSDLPAGRAQPDAGAAARRAGAAGSPGVRADVRSGARELVRRRGSGHVSAATSRSDVRHARQPAAAAPAHEIQALIARSGEEISRTISG